MTWAPSRIGKTIRRKIGELALQGLVQPGLFVAIGIGALATGAAAMNWAMTAPLVRKEA